MKVEDLVIGKEYYFDSSKTDRGIYRGQNKSGSLFFEPTENKYYLEETDNVNGFEGCVGFVSAVNKIPVEP